MERVQDLRCPVCRARFKGGDVCSRCDAVLRPLMWTVMRAYVARCESRRALMDEDYENAAAWAREAQRLHATAPGKRLLQISTWICEGFLTETGPSSLSPNS